MLPALMRASTMWVRFARRPFTKDRRSVRPAPTFPALAQAAREEIDHLAWTDRDSRTGRAQESAQPAWYGGAFTFGECWQRTSVMPGTWDFWPKQSGRSRRI